MRVNIIRVLAIVTFLSSLAATASAQEIKVSPSAVNAYSQGATTVFLTFSNVINRRPVDACWCGELIEATPDIGLKCRPGTEFGCLPVRYNQSSLSANGTYTDIMSIPPSVARRAYLDAASGREATFFYVRRFVSTTGDPDEFVPVTIRLSGNGAAAPFSITNVKLTWGVDKPVILVKAGEKLPKIQAEIFYTGTGRVKGRWELVKPGEEMPSSRDLLTESTLPVEERGLKRRYTQLNRFNLFLPPVGRFILSGPEVWRVPSHLEGMYLVLLRIEAADDANAGANSSIEAGITGLPTGGVAGFAMPVLRYYVGASTGQLAAQTKPWASVLSPDDNAVVAADAQLEFTWSEAEGAAFYRIDIHDAQDNPVLSAVLPQAIRSYRSPSWLKDKLGGGVLKWRVVAFDKTGKQSNETPMRRLRFD